MTTAGQQPRGGEDLEVWHAEAMARMATTPRPEPVVITARGPRRSMMRPTRMPVRAETNSGEMVTERSVMQTASSQGPMRAPVSAVMELRVTVDNPVERPASPPEIMMGRLPIRQ
jgi:hypothetical protein